MTYSRNYLKIYVWQGLSFVLNLVSLFIVTPRLTTVPSVYGIYSLCVSMMIFLSYADLGFLSAGFKYASEKYARNEIRDEIKLNGFVLFILTIMITLIAVFFLALAINPGFILKDVTNAHDKEIARSLFLIMALFSYTTVLQKLLILVFGVRVQDYIYQKTNIFFSILKISSVFYFFTNGRSDIVGYFLFMQLMNLAAVLLNLFIIRRKFNYDFSLLVRSIRFSREMYAMTKALAYSSLTVSVLWILYYELDLLVISKVLGVQNVAFYAIGLTLTSFLRAFLATLYTPFSARFNHFIGQNDPEGLKKILTEVVFFLMPFVIYPLGVIIIYLKPFIFCWVGTNYTSSVFLASFLVAGFILNFITVPGSILMMAKEEVKKIYLLNTLMVVVFWGGIFSTYRIFGVNAFAVFKFLSYGLIAFFYVDFIRRYLDMNLKMIARKVLLPALPVFMMVYGVYHFTWSILPAEKGKLNFLVIILVVAGMIVLSIGIHFLADRSFRNFILTTAKNLLKKQETDAEYVPVTVTRPDIGS